MTLMQASPAMPNKKKKLEEWEIQQAASTLMEAQKIQKDPRLLKAATAELKRQRDAASTALSKIGALKKIGK